MPPPSRLATATHIYKWRYGTYKAGEGAVSGNRATVVCVGLWRRLTSFDHFGGCVYNCFDCCNGLLMTMMERWRGQSFEEERTSERAAFGSGVTKAARRSVWGLFRARGTSSSVLLSRPVHGPNTLMLLLLLPLRASANNLGGRPCCFCWGSEGEPFAGACRKLYQEPTPSSVFAPLRHWRHSDLQHKLKCHSRTGSFKADGWLTNGDRFRSTLLNFGRRSDSGNHQRTALQRRQETCGRARPWPICRVNISPSSCRDWRVRGINIPAVERL